MSDRAALLFALALLALAAAVALPSLYEGAAPPGSFALVPGGVGRVYRIDTASGDTWLSVDGGDWESIGEGEDGGDDETVREPRHPRPAPPPAARMVEVRR